MALTVTVQTDLTIHRDAAQKSCLFDLDDEYTKATLSTFTKHHDELIPALAAGSPGTPVAIDLARFTTVRGIQVITDGDIVVILDFGDGNGTREVPLAKGAASGNSTTTYARMFMEISGLSSLSVRNDGTAAAAVQFALYGT